MAADIPIPSIPQFFAEKNILITGGSGFLGKALIEKLLRCCPEVGNIYLLMRAKKGKDAEKRVNQITSCKVFDKLWKERPEAFNKLIPVHADIADSKLGLTDEDRSLLAERVNIVYHIAASVRFDDSLKYAILLNTRGTRELVSLALEMKNLTLFAHVSTAYANTQTKVIEEKLYPPQADWRKTIEIAEQVDSYTLDLLTNKYLGCQPNTYTFTKHLAEHVVNDMCTGRIPAVIIRPSVVTPSYKEPLSGWTDNCNGPAGVIIAVGTGLLRSLYMDPDITPDYIPVEFVIKGLISITWYESTLASRKSLEAIVYNACGGDRYGFTPKQLVHVGLGMVWQTGMEMQLFHPNTTVTTNIVEHYLRVLVLQVVPAILVDLFLKLTGKSPRLVKIQRKIYTASLALAYFCLNKWTFKNEKFISIDKKLLPRDVQHFSYDVDICDLKNYVYDCCLTGRQVLLHEDPKLMNSYRGKALRNKLIYYAVICLFYGTLFYYIVNTAMKLFI